MRKIMKFCFEKWWRPQVFALCSLILLFVAYFTESNIAERASNYLVVIAWIGLLISSIYLLSHRKWVQGIFNGVCFLVIGAIVSFFIAVFWIWFDSNFHPDKYADNLTIPTDITISTPIDSSTNQRRDSVANEKKSEVDFVLYSAFQPGLYEYDVWLGKMDSGTVYLKVYEITHNDRLSERSLATHKESILRVANSSDSLRRFGTKEYFKIYEGDFGKPYAARFEVWYKPDNGNERKLIEKNYKIEGWMR